MIYLLLSILFSTFTVIFFKVFELKKVDTFQAIVFNYLSCTIAGNIFANHTIFSPAFWLTPWFPFALILGFLFITIFFAIGKTAQEVSASASMVAAKLSVVIPVLFAVIFYNESLKGLQILGIVLSLVSVYLMSASKENTGKKMLWLLPLIVFAGSGAIDTLLNYVEQQFIPAFESAQIITSVFFVAFVFGTLFFVFQLLNQKTKFDPTSAFWGMALGIPNYFSMYFLLKTLSVFDGSFIFPINNIGIVAATAVAARLLFAEHLNKRMLLGLGLALLAIVLISLA
jgi:drug/metabolite transporter (DMT)-like permease